MIDPASSRTEGYHIFLEPDGALRERLQSCIEDLAREFGGPVFSPHVTLAARIPADAPVREVTAALAAETRPFDLRFGLLAMEDAYFRALYIQMEDIEELKALHAKTFAAFGMTPTSTYVPHTSLVYGNLSQQAKEAVLPTIVYPEGEVFPVRSLALYETPGETETWRKIEEFPLLG